MSHPSRTSLLLLLKAARTFRRAEGLIGKINKGQHATLAEAQYSRNEARTKLFDAVKECQ